jgi:plasmid stabilization system protein ParE
MLNILWSEQAEQDLEQILSYYLEQAGMRVAESVYARIKEQIGTLNLFPERTRLGRVEGTRECVISRLPYIAVIEVSANAVRVLNIIHTAKKYP